MGVQQLGELLWKVMPDGPEKYQAYLCSREWAELRVAVRRRSGGTCERCKVPSNIVEVIHHLTYARKYHEALEDLQGLCRLCHEFIHGKSNVDPIAVEASRLRQPAPLVIPDNYHFGRTLIVCPYCGCQECHIDPPSWSVEGPDWNQGRIVIPSSCEGGHAWDMVLNGDQGTLTAFTANYREYNPGEGLGDA